MRIQVYLPGGVLQTGRIDKCHERGWILDSHIAASDVTYRSEHFIKTEKRAARTTARSTSLEHLHKAPH
jgi:hypothetical protein